MTKARGCKVASQEGSPGGKPHAPRSAIIDSHTPKGTPTLGIRVPVDSRMFRERLQGSMDWGVLNIISKILECRCLKWARIAHLDIWNTSYGQKKGQESNWQFDSRPLKVKNRPDFVTCRWCATCCWKAFDEAYNFASNLISIRGLNAKLWGPKVVGVPPLAISGLPLGSPMTKSHLDVGPMGSHRVYYKVEGGGFPQIRAMVSLVNSNRPWFVLTPKVFQLCTNHLVLVLCRPMWVSEACQFLLVPSQNSSMPLYPSTVLRAREHARFFIVPLFFYVGLTFESIKELGARYFPNLRHMTNNVWIFDSCENSCKNKT